MPLLVVKMKRSIINILLLTCLLAGCQGGTDGPGVPTRLSPSFTLAATAAPFATATAHPTNTPTATIQPLAFWRSPSLPPKLLSSISLPDGVSITEDASQSNLQLEVWNKTGKPRGEAVDWVYALAAPFPTVADEVTLTGLQALWKGRSPASFPLQTLLVDSSTASIFTQLWGKPGSPVKVTAAEKLLDNAWKAPGAGAIIPFEKLEPRWKVLAVDGQSPVWKDFRPDSYGLTVRFVLQGEGLDRVALRGPIAESNRNPDHLTTVVVTGVTALVRGTGSYMERYGNTYPASEIGPWLREADILHISNEVAFARTCPPPYNWEGLAFCSRTKYIELLEDIGTDVVELSGDHFQDWGNEAILYTLDLYKERGWQYYGGGANAAEALQPARFEHNGNRIAFLGCNAKPPGYATASKTSPGALHCDMDQMVEEVKKLRAEGYLPIVTFQHLEYYSYDAHPILIEDFTRMADAGAIIVSGSQAHQPHAMAFENGAFLHYGLGNLFFDQTNQGDAPRTSFIDRHVFYDGKHISSELLTIYLVNYALQRPMTPEEREALLRTIYEASGWTATD